MHMAQACAVCAVYIHALHADVAQAGAQGPAFCSLV